MPAAGTNDASPRTARRLAPRQSATAAVYRGEQQLAYGIVRNVSLSGACIITDSSLPPGMDVLLKLSFYEQPTLIETSARVIWNGRAGAEEPHLRGMLLHGVFFTLATAMERARLSDLLRSDAFVSTYDPDTTEFDHLQSSLSDALDELGAKLGRAIGADNDD